MSWYQRPEWYVCDTCKHWLAFNYKETHPAPVTSNGDPVCPECWDKFLRDAGLVMRHDKEVSK